MASLSKAQRKRIPTGDYGVVKRVSQAAAMKYPSKYRTRNHDGTVTIRMFPMQDKKHALAASRLSGRSSTLTSAAQRLKVKKTADKKLAKKKAPARAPKKKRPMKY